MNTPNAPTGFDPETLDSAVLQSLRRDLRDVLIPELSTENARGTARLLDEMLGWVAVDLDETAPKLAPKSNVKDRIRQEALRLAAEDDAVSVVRRFATSWRFRIGRFSGSCGLRFKRPAAGAASVDWRW